MSFKIDLKYDVKKLISKLDNYQKNVVPAATSSALNKLAVSARVETARNIYEIIGRPKGFSAAKIKKQVTIVKANRNKLRASLNVEGKSIPMIAFNAIQNSSGVTATVMGKTKFYKGYFIAKVSGHKGVFRREGGQRGTARRVKKGINKGKLYKPELKIKEKKGLYIGRVYASKQIELIVHEHVKERFPKLFESELRFRLSKL